MCGISGKIYLGSGAAAETDILKMNQSVQHRGPDDGGVYLSPDKKVGLGQRRLSIIDLSPLGHQPMSYKERYWIVFNGEIYNFQEKRDMLKRLGYQFKSKTDTEVIIALYDKYGRKCLDHLRGMFALAIYDEKEKTIFCARDRLGKKPFKYYLNDQVFIFASELKAILTQKEYKRKPDFTAINHYLTLQYCPAPLTGFKDIRKLPPAHYLFLDLKTNKVEIKRYWKLDFSKKLNLPEEKWEKKILEKLEESVKIRMIADVPLGAFLSGGVDSSAVVGLMSQNSPQPVKTFSIGFKEAKFNELPYARLIAKKFKTEHTEFIVQPEAIDVLPLLVKQYEEPYADSSALPTYYVSKLTRNHVTVALNGDGGDENFAGYPWYSIQKFVNWYQKTAFIHNLTVAPFCRVLNNKLRYDFLEKVNRFAKTISLENSRRYLHYICYFTNEMKDQLYTAGFKEKMAGEDTFSTLKAKFEEAGTSNQLDQCFYTDINTYLPDDLLVKVDMATMLVALEGRSPFLDHEFMELTAKIPANLKLRGINNKKYLLKKALEKFVPREILYRPKRGFQVPIEAWFKKDLKKFMEKQLLSQKFQQRKIFRTEYIKSLIDDHSSNRNNYSKHLWALLTLELWFQEYFD